MTMKEKIINDIFNLLFTTSVLIYGIRLSSATTTQLLLSEVLIFTSILPSNIIDVKLFSSLLSLIIFPEPCILFFVKLFFIKNIIIIITARVINNVFNLVLD